MSIFNKLILINLLLAANISVFAQKQLFDIVTFTAPYGWQKSAEANAVQFTKQNGNAVGIMMLFKSLPTGKDSKTTFDASWDSIVKGLLTKVDSPQMQPTAGQNGWTIESGAALGEKDGDKLVAMLISATGGGKVVNLLVLYNSESFQTDIDSFIGSIDLPKVSQNSGESNQSTSKSPTKSASGVKELDGLYPSCSMWGYPPGSTSRTVIMGRTQRFIIKNGSYSVYKGKGGTVKYVNGIATFVGGDFDGWKAMSEILADGDFILYFRADRSKTSPLDAGRFVGDEQCRRTTGEL